MPSPVILVKIQLAQEQGVGLRVDADVAGKGSVNKGLIVFVAILFHLGFQRRVRLEFLHHVVDLLRGKNGLKMLMPDFIGKAGDRRKIRVVCRSLKHYVVHVDHTPIL